MSVYPFRFDDDSTIIRVDDNITEIGSESINQLRSATFSIEQELGLTPSGSKSSLTERLAVSLDDNGNIKASALASIGLVTLPIVDSHVAFNAGIKEYKLDLDFSTADLHVAIENNTALLNAIAMQSNSVEAVLNSHIGGGGGDSTLRHVASHIDLNNIPNDTRDISYVWNGLHDVNGNLLSATTVAEALDYTNQTQNDHINAVSPAVAHNATAISVDTTDFIEIDVEVTNVQEALQALDEADRLKLGGHRATQHSNGIPKQARSYALNLADGYGINIVSLTQVETYLSSGSPSDDVNTGDDVVRFVLPSDSDDSLIFQSQFAQVIPGDIIRIDYGNGLAGEFVIDSVKNTVGTEFVVRLSSTNLAAVAEASASPAYATINRSTFDSNTYGILAVGASNPTPFDEFSGIGMLASLVVADPKAASVLGNGFDQNQLDETHYNLYIQLYPNGNPRDKVINLPAIDVTGDQGARLSGYTIKGIVQNINNAFRQSGYNYRFVAFEKNGDIGISLADSINNVSFSIVSGQINSGSFSEGIYTNNIVGVGANDNFDALGFGPDKANVASPAWVDVPANTITAQNPTLVFSPRRKRNYVVNGRETDMLSSAFATLDGYWDATMVTRAVEGNSLKATYEIDLDLSRAGLKPGKTITVQPTIDITSASYNNNDYGRFIIESIDFEDCPGVDAKTTIKVINSIHGTGNPLSAATPAPLNVRIYFGADSVGFNTTQISDPAETATNYRRFHEIFITEDLLTFAHERARMPIQTGSDTLLNTSVWHITDVSPKLVGYTDDTTSKDRFVRLYITNYNSSDDSFDGYIGKRNPSTVGITEFGPIVHGSKKTPTRFYDITGVDFIELELRELNTTGFVTEVTVPRYIDIELFPSQELNKELFLIAGCELNWRTDTSTFFVENVIDKRQFGSISETDFTESAVDFIRAINKVDTTNGVIRGFDIQSNPDTSDADSILIKGGSAVVDGNIVNVNNEKIKFNNLITLATTSSGSSGTLLGTQYGYICLNSIGNFIFINRYDIEFLRNRANPAQYYYNINCATETNLLNRKDLLPLYYVAFSYDSSSKFTLTDVRKYKNAEAEQFGPIVVGQNSVGTQSFGTFKSLQSAYDYLVHFGEANSEIVVRGKYIINSSESLSISNSTLDRQYEIVLRGSGPQSIIEINSGGSLTLKSVKVENLTFNVNVNSGIILYNDVSFINCKFTYTQPFAPPNTEEFLDTSYTMMLLEQYNTENITIDSCMFSAGVRQHYPWIKYHCTGDFYYCKNVNISNNTFIDSVGYSAGNNNPAIVFRSDRTSLQPSLMTGIKITNNNLYSKNGIIFQSTGSSGSTDLPLHLNDVLVSGNTCGYIGIGGGVPEGFNPSSSLYICNNNVPGVRVVNNNCEFIGGNLRNRGVGVYPKQTQLDGDFGNIVIANNTLSTIYTSYVNQINGFAFTGVQNTGLSISGNVFNVGTSNIATKVYGTSEDSRQYAISVYGGGSINISNNTISNGNINGTVYNVSNPIFVRVPHGNVIISNNIIGGISQETGIGSNPIDSIGIYVELQNQLVTENINNRLVNITGNTITRQDSININHFIYVNNALINSDDKTKVLISNNVLSHSSVSSSITNDNEDDAIKVLQSFGSATLLDTVEIRDNLNAIKQYLYKNPFVFYNQTVPANFNYTINTDNGTGGNGVSAGDFIAFFTGSAGDSANVSFWIKFPKFSGNKILDKFQVNLFQYNALTSIDGWNPGSIIKFTFFANAGTIIHEQEIDISTIPIGTSSGTPLLTEIDMPEKLNINDYTGVYIQTLGTIASIAGGSLFDADSAGLVIKNFGFRVRN